MKPINHTFAITTALAVALTFSTSALANDNSDTRSSAAIISSLINENMIVQYNNRDLVSTAVNPSGEMMSFEYDVDGNIAVVKDGRGIETHYDTNQHGRIIKKVSGERGKLSYIYDDVGRLKLRTQANGIVTRFKYDDAGRRDLVTVKDGVNERINERYTYDSCGNGLGQICKITRNGEYTKFDYTPQGNVSKVIVGSSDGKIKEITKYEYNADGQINRIKYPSGLIVKYHHADGNVVKVTAISKNSVGENKHFLVAESITYGPINQLPNKIKFGNGILQREVINSEGQLEKLSLNGSISSILENNYIFNENGRIESIQSTAEKNTREYSYDNSGRLKQEIIGSNASEKSIANYKYDAAYNRVERTIISSSGITKRQKLTYAFDSNRLVKSRKNLLSYDLNGNLVRDRSGKRQFEYDATNRMSAFYKNGELRASYKYNFLGQRISKTLHNSQADVTEAGWKTWRANYGMQGQRLGESGYKPHDNNTFLKVFSRDIIWLGDIPLAQIEKGHSEKNEFANIVYLHTDHLGAPTTGTNQDQAVVWSWNRDAYGRVKPNKDPDGDGLKTRVPLRLPGQVHDAESGLFYNNQRDYDPNLGRYIQSDPIGLLGGINRYAYVLGDPVNNTDPSGLSGCTGTRTKRCSIAVSGNLYVGGVEACGHFSGHDPVTGYSISGHYYCSTGFGSGLIGTGLTGTGPIGGGSGGGSTLCAGACTPIEEPRLAANGLPCASDFMDAYQQVDYSVGDTGLSFGLGGNVGSDIRDGANSCSIRVSCALNASGLLIPSIPNQSTIFTEGSNEGSRVLYDTRALHSFLGRITPNSRTNLSTSQIRPLLTSGQVAITVRPAVYTDNGDGTESISQFGHAGVVTIDGYTDPNIPRSGNDVWILDACPVDE